MNKLASHRWTAIDIVAAIAAVGFGIAITLYPIRNNDIWWLLASGRLMLESASFIYADPFTFSAAGTPWSPQAFLSSIVFYLVYKGGSEVGLIAFRVVLVSSAVGVLLWTIRRAGVSLLFALPVVMVVLMNAQTRFTVRAHLFEYLFIVILVAFLLNAHRIKGKAFFVVPVLVQLLWTNSHPSYLLGPALVAMYFGGEWLSGVLGQRSRMFAPVQEWQWQRVLLLIGLMGVACVINPNPILFLQQPLGGDQRELISRYTLEWRSPFDPALRIGSFHPYYEILLGLTALALLIGLAGGRLSLALVLPVLATAVMSLQSHRFRVEFALVSLPLMATMLRNSALVERWRAAAGTVGARAATSVAVIAALAVAYFARPNIDVGSAIADRYPTAAMDFLRDNGVGERTLTTIGHGSYMIWHLYGERKTFIDGRNFNNDVYTDFIKCQSNDVGFELTARKYNLDAFLIPAIERSDAGMSNIHEALVKRDDWLLAYMDEFAYVYVHRPQVPEAWLASNAYHEYHPSTLQSRPLNATVLDAIIAELHRATQQSPTYVRVWTDLALAQSTRGLNAEAMDSFKEAARLSPGNAQVWSGMGRAALAAGRHDDAVTAFTELARLAPQTPASHFYLAQAQAASGAMQAALASANQAVALDPRMIDAFVLIARINMSIGDAANAMNAVNRVLSLQPDNAVALQIREQLRGE